MTDKSRVIENVTIGLREWLLQLPDVVEAPHSFGGTEYQVNGRQFMHNHGPRYLDIHLSREDQERVIREGKAERHRFTPARRDGLPSTYDRREMLTLRRN
ncbi:hypothetical protein E6H18_09760 [Candidatus Bathyarchaeota archaeon]|nr:MAG: hypothetical protein E6H18_09760 [Candidatus Bathyarchaeota archaeon]